MLGTFLGLQTSLSGLQAAQEGINTVSHNIDNANTPGYARETVNLTEAPAIDVPGGTSGIAGQVGQGVDVQQIQRQTSSFLNGQYREQNSNLGQANVEQTTLNQVSGIINEPSTTGISHAMGTFWQAWDTLSSNPDQLSARTSVVDSAQTLTDVMNQTANQLSDLHTSVGKALTDSVSQVNSILGQVSNLSDQIVKVQQTGNQPNDLMDQRSALLDKLSTLTNFKTSTTHVQNAGVGYDEFSLTLTGVPASGANQGKATDITVIDGSQPLGKTLVGSLSMTNASDPSAGVTVNGTVQTTDPTTGKVTTTATSGDFSQQSGQIAGYQTSLSDVKNYQDDLNVLAQSLAGANGQGTMTVTLQGGLDISSATLSQNGNVPISVPGSSAKTISDYVNAQPQPVTMPVTLPAGSKVTVNGINQLLQLGYSESGQGKALFGSSDGQPINASNINVAITGPDLAAAGRAGANGDALSGDGTLATVVSNVQNAQMSFPSPASSSQTLNGTMGDYLTSAVGQLGLQGQQANNAVNTQQTLVTQLDNARQSVSGVSIDEEMTHMISYQQAYNASSKMISTINNMLTQLMQNV